MVPREYPTSSGAILGSCVALRKAHIDERRLIYGWLACSDVSGTMSGPPTYPERPVPTWEEFQDGYTAHYFDDSAPHLGRCLIILADGEPVGQVNYNEIEERGGRKQTELDIWMRSEAHCGRGYGSDALVTLCRYLSERFGVQAVMVQPSARNPRAIRAYEKIGFKRLEIPVEAAQESWGPSDYTDSVYMIKECSAAAS
jgi:RimJ/RimL family protein N-acetyltransferase